MPTSHPMWTAKTGLHRFFEVDDVDVAYQQLRDKGITFVTEPLDRPDWGIRTAHFRDPDGNLIEIYNNLDA